MHRTRVALASALACAALLAAGDSGASGSDIMTKAETSRRVREMTARATLTTGGGGQERVKVFQLWTKLGDDGVRYRMMLRFASPAEIRNEGVLIRERASGENEVLVYLPRYKKTRRVEGQSQGTSFMGTVFSYSDIAAQHAADFQHNHLRTETCPNNAGGQCDVVESVPRTEEIKGRTGYGKAVQWVRTDNGAIIKGEYFDTEGHLWKTSQASDVREVDPGAHRWLAHTVRIDDHKDGKYTVLHFDQVQVNGGIDESIFTPQNLARE
jgi:hypothetical protein